MAEISILMSIYNESESQIRESVESMLSQTFSDFELIVVNDNPQRLEVKEILESYNDSRLVFIQNEQNMGLAMCMNKAASIASAEIYARMDADDVALPRRLEIEYNTLKDEDVDYVFTPYSYIDEESLIIERPIIPYCTQSELRSLKTSITGIIHHPTVMFTKSIFEKAGKYRNFPCSQDLDLWLRMIEVSCRFSMTREVLLMYRINSQSVSSKKWFQQQLTCDYIQQLAYERLRSHGSDSFSENNYAVFLKKMGLGNPKAEEKLKSAYSYLRSSVNAKKRNKTFQSLFLKAKAMLISPILRRRAVLQLKKMLIFG